MFDISICPELAVLFFNPIELENRVISILLFIPVISMFFPPFLNFYRFKEFSDIFAQLTSFCPFSHFLLVTLILPIWSINFRFTIFSPRFTSFCQSDNFFPVLLIFTFFQFLRWQTSLTEVTAACFLHQSLKLVPLDICIFFK